MINNKSILTLYSLLAFEYLSQWYTKEVLVFQLHLVVGRWVQISFSPPSKLLKASPSHLS